MSGQNMVVRCSFVDSSEDGNELTLHNAPKMHCISQTALKRHLSGAWHWALNSTRDLLPSTHQLAETILLTNVEVALLPPSEARLRCAVSCQYMVVQ